MRMDGWMIGVVNEHISKKEVKELKTCTQVRQLKYPTRSTFPFVFSFPSHFSYPGCTEGGERRRAKAILSI